MENKAKQMQITPNSRKNFRTQAVSFTGRGSDIQTGPRLPVPAYLTTPPSPPVSICSIFDIVVNKYILFYFQKLNQNNPYPKKHTNAR
jgi:hypothetical protein